MVAGVALVAGRAGVVEVSWVKHRQGDAGAGQLDAGEGEPPTRLVLGAGGGDQLKELGCSQGVALLGDASPLNDDGEKPFLDEGQRMVLMFNLMVGDGQALGACSTLLDQRSLGELHDGHQLGASAWVAVDARQAHRDPAVRKASVTIVELRLHAESHGGPKLSFECDERRAGCDERRLGAGDLWALARVRLVACWHLACVGQRTSGLDLVGDADVSTQAQSGFETGGLGVKHREGGLGHEGSHRDEVVDGEEEAGGGLLVQSLEPTQERARVVEGDAGGGLRQLRGMAITPRLAQLHATLQAKGVGVGPQDVSGAASVRGSAAKQDRRAARGFDDQLARWRRQGVERMKLSAGLQLCSKGVERPHASGGIAQRVGARVGGNAARHAFRGPDGFDPADAADRG